MPNAVTIKIGMVLKKVQGPGPFIFAHSHNAVIYILRMLYKWYPHKGGQIPALVQPDLRQILRVLHVMLEALAVGTGNGYPDPAALLENIRNRLYMKLQMHRIIHSFL